MRPTLKLRQEQALENTVLGFPSGRSVKSLCEAVFLCRSRDLSGQPGLAKVNWFSLPHSWPYYGILITVWKITQIYPDNPDDSHSGPGLINNSCQQLYPQDFCLENRSQREQSELCSAPSRGEIQFTYVET